MATAARVASVIVGINDYEAGAYTRPGFALRYAVADAEAFHRYVRDAWPSGVHVLLLDRDANADAIRASFETICVSGPYDLLLVYFAGHGEIARDGRGWFCTVAARPGAVDLDALQADRLLGAVEASATIVLLDCCYAESVFGASTYFRNLGPARAKLFLCSARRDQLTFEDDVWGHGALSHLLLQALAADSPLPRTEGAVSVAGALFPYLCEQLPLLVFRAKAGARQEPVMGGVSAAAVTLPSAATVVRTRDTTIFEVVRARYRQVLASTASLALALVVLNQLMLYHFGVGSDGFLQVRRGIAPLAWATIPGFDLHVETTIAQTELTAVHPTLATRFKEGAIWGVWTQKAAGGERRWAEQLALFLAPPAAERLNLLAGAGLSDHAFKDDRFAGVQWRPDTLADAIVLSAPAAAPLRRAYLGQLPTMDEYACDRPVDNRMDFTILGMSTSDVLFYLDSLQAYLAKDNRLAPELLESAMKLVLYRARHLTRGHAGAEFESAVAEYRAFVHLLEEASARRWTLTLQSTTAPEDNWCEPGTLAPTLLSSAGAARDDAVQRLLAMIDPATSRMGDAFSFRQLAALDALEAAARRGRLPADAVTTILAYLRADGRGLDGYPALVEFLIHTAPLQPLPDSVRAELQAELTRSHDKYSFIAVRSFDILARNARFATPADRALLENYLQTAIARFQGTDDLADALGYAGCSGIGVAAARAYLAPRVKDRELVRPNRQSVLGFEVISAGDDFAEGGALGRIAQTTQDHAEFDRLERFALNRLGVVDPAPIVRALAVRASHDTPPDHVLQAVQQALEGARTSGRRQELVVAVAVEELLLLPPRTRAAALEQVRTIWRAEREPDLKMNWGRILLRTERRSATFDAHPCVE